MGEPLIIGRYMVCDPIGAGGMATVHLGRLLGAAGFSRVVAIKRLDAARAESDKLATMLIDEARIVSRIRHPNVNPTLDVVRADGELLLVMEYVHGPSLAWLRAALESRGARVPSPVAARVIIDVLGGLHAAHNARSEQGQPLGLVHRDVSPQNIVVGDDGLARVLDFGVAKAEGRLSFSVLGEIKGKLGYMAPEQLRGERVDPRADVYACGVVLGELLSGQPLFQRAARDPVPSAIAQRASIVATLAERLGDVEPGLVEVVATALAVAREDRFASAAEMAASLAARVDAATHEDVASWLKDVAGDLLARRLLQIEQIEQVSAVGATVTSTVAAAPTAGATLPFTKPAQVPEPPRPAQSTLKLAPATRPDRTLPLRRSAAPAPADPRASAAPLHGARVEPRASARPAARGRLDTGRALYVGVALVALLILGIAGGLLLHDGRSRSRDVGRVRPGIDRPASR